jgi:ferredoxin--NADP+ reductase
VAQRIAGEVSDANRRGGSGLRELLAERHVSIVDYASWKRIDAAELADAGDERCRKKFTRIADMLEAAQTGKAVR